MISSLRGKLITVREREILLDVNGVGYQIFVSKCLAGHLTTNDREYNIITHLDVKENSLILYGFADEKERELFKMLITVSGVGPKLAHTILTHSTFEEVMGLLTGSNRNMKIPGIGAKKLDLITMTLKDKIFKIAAESSGEISQTGPMDKNVMDAVNALVSLGYSRNEADKIIKEVTKSGETAELSTEEIIRKSLQFTS